MSWSNPSQQEAQECYDAAKKKYDTAAEEYLNLKNIKEQIEEQEAALKKQYCDLETEQYDLVKLDFNLQRLVRNLKTGDGNVDRKVTLSRVGAIQVTESLKACIVCSGMQPPPLGRACYSPWVGDETFSARAKQIVDQEAKRVQERLAELQNNLNSTLGAHQSLEKMISSYESNMTDLKKIMDSCAFDMEHYKKYL